MTVDVLRLYRRLAKLRKSGLSEAEIGAACGIRQWTVSRVLRLDGLTPALRGVLGGSGVASLSALAEIASWPERVQRAATDGIVLLVAKRGGRTIRRCDVAPVMARHGRDLDRAPFPTSACRPCTKRTGAQPDFFGDVAADSLGRCNDARCFARCMNAVAARRARWSRLKISGGNEAARGKRGKHT